MHIDVACGQPLFCCISLWPPTTKTDKDALFDFGDRRAVVYLTSWAKYRVPGAGEWKDPHTGATVKYDRPDWCAEFASTPAIFNPQLATHLVYGFFVLSDDYQVSKCVVNQPQPIRGMSMESKAEKKQG